MKITAIKAQVKCAGRYSIFIDEEYSFSLSDSALLKQKLIVGQEVSKEELAQYKQLSADDKIYMQTLNYLALRPRSRYEIEQYLYRKQVSPVEKDEILNKLSEMQMINDRAFAKAWVESRRLLKATSRRRLQLELHQKRIPDDIVREVLAEDEVSDHTALLAMIERKRKQTKYQDTSKLIQYLARQGFSYDDIKQAMAESDSLDD